MVLPLGTSCLRILSCGNIGYAYAMVMLQAFNGAGDTITPTIVNLFGFWFLEIPLAYWLAIPVGLHSKGVFFSIVIAEGAIAVASVLLFKRGRWKHHRIYRPRTVDSELSPEGQTGRFDFLPAEGQSRTRLLWSFRLECSSFSRPLSSRRSRRVEFSSVHGWHEMDGLPHKISGI